MVKSESFEHDGRTLCRTYSDTNKYVHKIGTDETYKEAIDIYPCPYAYEEVDAPDDDEVDTSDDEEIRPDELAWMIEEVL